MAKASKIEWTDATFNPWIGCTKVSPGCAHCYAEAQDHRWGHKRWGATAPRTRTSANYWVQPLLWNEAAKKSGRPFRVFCASLADVCEDRAELLPIRADLMRLIEATPYITWLLLTKRPENFERFFGGRWTPGGWPKNVVAMTTVENQDEADRRVPEILKVPAAVLGLSAEPLLGPVVLRPEWVEAEVQAFGGKGVNLFPRIQWVIAGGESGSRNDARPMHPDWARSLRDQCAAHDVAFLFKQWGSWMPVDQPHAVDESIAKLRPNEKWWNRAGGIGFHGEQVYRMAHVDKHVAGRLLDGRTHDEFPREAR